jgi:hypothetical protein
MTPRTTPSAARHDTLSGVPSKGTDRRTIRVEPDLWDEFGTATANEPDGRSGVVRAFMRWYLGKPGANLPGPTGGLAPKPGAEEAPETS